MVEPMAVPINMAELPLITVITTSYNRARYLGSTIRSVLDQSYTNFEYIVLDDCSTDDSLSVAENFLRDPRLVVISNESNLGDYGNRNKGLALARGQYVKYVDCDDILYPHCLASMVEVAESFPDSGVVFSYSKPLAYSLPVELSSETVYRLHYSLGGILHQGAMSALLKRESMLAVGGFVDIYTGDVACWLNLARKYPVVLMPGGLFWWRQHAGQLSESMRTVSPKWALHQTEGVRLHWDALNRDDCPLLESERFRFQYKIAFSYAALILKNSARLRFGVVHALLKSWPFGGAASDPPELRPVSRISVDSPSGAVGTGSSHSEGDEGGAKIKLVGSQVTVFLHIGLGVEGVAETIRSVVSQEFSHWELMICIAHENPCLGYLLSLFNSHPQICFTYCAADSAWGELGALVVQSKGVYLKFLFPGVVLEKSALASFCWYMEHYPESGLVISEESERFLLPQLLGPSEVLQASCCGVFDIMSHPIRVLYLREAWVRCHGDKVISTSCWARLNLAIAMLYPSAFIRGGLVLSAPPQTSEIPVSAKADLLMNCLRSNGHHLSGFDYEPTLRWLQRSIILRSVKGILGQGFLGRIIANISTNKYAIPNFLKSLEAADPLFDRSLYP